jgi:WD40 repeat protein
MARALTWVEAHPKQDLLALGDEEGRVILWNSRQGGVVRTLAHDGFIVNLRWSPDGERLVALEMGGRMTVYDQAGERLQVVETGHEKLCAGAFHASGDRFVTAGHAGRIIVWSREDFRELYRLPLEKTGGASAVCFAADYLVAGFEDGWFEAFASDGKENVAGGEILNGRVASVGVTPSGDAVVFGGGRGSMVAMAAGPDWVCLESYKGTPPKPIAVNQISFAPKGKSFVAACSDDTALIFNWEERSLYGRSCGSPFYSRSPKPEWSRDMIVASACFDRKRPIVYTAHFDGRLRVWDKNTLVLVTLSFDEKGTPLVSDGRREEVGGTQLWEERLG